MAEFDEPGGPQMEPLRSPEPVRRPLRTPEVPKPQPETVVKRNNNPPRLAAILLLIVAAVYLLLGADVKRTVYPDRPGTGESVPDEIVLDLKDNITSAEIRTIEQTFGIQLHDNSIYSRDWKLMVAKVPPERRTQILEALKHHPGVEIAEPQFVYHQYANPTPPNDPEYQKQWHLKMIHIEEAWAVTRGKGAVVAVVDSGVGAEVKGQYVQLQDFGTTQFGKGYNFADKNDIPADENGHGTHVAGTIAESTNNGALGAGVAPEATLIPVRVMASNGTGKMADIVDGIKFAVDQGANVINLSLGGPFSQLQEKVCQYAYQKNVTLMCAAGNDNKEGFDFPGNLKECLVVGAVGPQETRAPYSNFGDKLDIAAPGGDTSQGAQGGIWQNTVRRRPASGPFQYAPRPAIDGFFPLQGTSMATPHAAGVAALLVSLGIKDPAQIRSILRKTAKAHGPAKEYGTGILDAQKAVESVSKSKQNSWSSLWVIGGIAIVFLLKSGGTNKKTTAGKAKAKGKGAPSSSWAPLIWLGVGWFTPWLLEKVFGFGSLLNLLGHSTILPIVWLVTPNMPRPTLLQAAGFTCGVMAHLLLDVRSGVTPLQVQPQGRIDFWLYVNVAAGAYFLYTAFQQTGARKKLAPAR